MNEHPLFSRVRLRLFLLFFSMAVAIFLIAKEFGVLETGLLYFVVLKPLHFPYSDKIGHFAAVGIFTLVINLIYGIPHFQWLGIRFPKVSFWVFLIATVDEVTQHWRPLRSFDFLDWLSNALGVLVFTWISYLVHHQISPPPTTENHARQSDL